MTNITIHKTEPTDAKALLIIDMQKGLFTTPRYDAEVVVDRINRLSTVFRQMDFPVIFIQHDGSKTGELVKGSTDWELLDELNVEQEDIVIDKTVNSSFYKSSLQQTLQKLNVKDLVIAGAATEFCVESTIQAAIVQNYNVTIASDAHTTADREHLSAKNIISHHNWVWKNMIPISSGLEVIESDEILRNIKLGY